MGLFSKKSIAERVGRQFDANACGPNLHVVDEMFTDISGLTTNELDRLPLTGEDIAAMYPDNESGFNAAFDTAMMCGRLDVVIACQDILGAAAYRSVSRIRLIPSNATCGPALVAIHAVAAVVVRDRVGSTFDNEDRRRGSTPPYFIPKAESFTEIDFRNAVAPWEAAFGRLQL